MTDIQIILIKGVIVFTSGIFVFLEVGKYGLHQVIEKQLSGLLFSFFVTLINLGIITVFLLPTISTNATQTILSLIGTVSSSDSLYTIPAWAKNWLDPPYLPTFLGLIAGYSIGKIKAKATSDPICIFNKGRIYYEHCRKKYGYWFPKGWPAYYAREDIAKIENLFADAHRLMKDQEEKDEDKSGGMWNEDEIKWHQRWMVFFYQRALFLSSCKKFKDSIADLESAYEYLKIYEKDGEALDRELMETKSQIFFLQGENLMTLGERTNAEKYLNRSLEIDIILNDENGILNNQDRLSKLQGE